MKPFTTWPKDVRERFYPLTTKQSRVLHAARKAVPTEPVCGAKIPSQWGRTAREWDIVPGAEKALCPKCAAAVMAEQAPENASTPEGGA